MILNLFYLEYCLVGFLTVYITASFNRLITSVEEERAVFFCYRLLVILLFLFDREFPNHLCARERLHYFCGTSWAFQITNQSHLNIEIWAYIMIFLFLL